LRELVRVGKVDVFDKNSFMCKKSKMADGIEVDFLAVNQLVNQKILFQDVGNFQNGDRQF
jgi:hypothetical protein